jgi:hypothetical protein
VKNLLLSCHNNGKSGFFASRRLTAGRLCTERNGRRRSVQNDDLAMRGCFPPPRHAGRKVLALMRGEGAISGITNRMLRCAEFYHTKHEDDGSAGVVPRSTLRQLGDGDVAIP